MEKERAKAEAEEVQRQHEERQKELAKERENPDQIDVEEMKEWTDDELDYLEKRMRTARRRRGRVHAGPRRVDDVP